MVVPPAVVLEVVTFLQVDGVNARSATIDFEIPLQPPGGRGVVGGGGGGGGPSAGDRLGDEDLGRLRGRRRSSDVNSGQETVETTGDGTGGEGGRIIGRSSSAGLQLLGDPVGDEAVAGGIPDGHDAFGGGTGQLEELDPAGGQDGVQPGTIVEVEIIGSDQVDLVDDDEDELVGEQGSDAGEEMNLGGDGVAAMLGEVHEVEDGGA